MKHSSTASLVPEFGYCLSAARLSRGLTLSDFGLMYGVSKGFICLIENGHRLPSIGLYRLFAFSVGCPTCHHLPCACHLLELVASATAAREKRSSNLSISGQTPKESLPCSEVRL